MTHCHEQAPDEPPERDAPIEWRVWPARHAPALSILVAIFAVSLSVAVVLFYESPWYGVMALLILFAATTSHYLPTRYQLDADGMKLRTPLVRTLRPWTAFAAYFADGDSIFLSPYSKLNWMAYRRGIRLRCPHNCAEVQDYVERHVPAAGHAR